MGSLSLLLDESKNTHLLLTSSNLAEIYVYDTLKIRCKATLDSIVEVNNSSSFKYMCELINMQPSLADKWFFVLEYKKVKTQLKKYKGIFDSTSSIFLIKVDDYKEFKEFKNDFPFVNDIYLNSIRRNDVEDLYRGYKISQKCVEFASITYYKEPDKVFQLLKELQNGGSIDSVRDIIKLCGESTSNIQVFAMHLLSDATRVSNGEISAENLLKRTFKKRVGILNDLCDSFKPDTAYNYITSCIKDILYIKVLYLEGIIYDRIADLPDCFDEKKLSKYNFCLKSIINNMTYGDILRLYSNLKLFGRWEKNSDAILFLYNYYLNITNNVEV